MAANAAGVADATASAWREIEQALRPILGSGGVRGLFQRSLHLAANEHPWLARDNGDDEAGNAEPDALQATLAQGTTAEAQAAASSFLRHFDQLLSSLVGSTLTARLLRPVWTVASGLPNEQDTRR